MMTLSSGQEKPESVDGNAARVADIVVIGAGLAGTCAATVLKRAGHSVVLVDFHAVHQNEFRAEKLGAPHMELFEKLGLGPIVKSVVTPMDDNHVYRFGALFSRRKQREYGFSYAHLINTLRAEVAVDVPALIAKVTEIADGPLGQRVTLSDGTVVDARLVVLATGLGEAVRRLVNIRRREDAKAHSLSIGFNLAGSARTFPFETLTYHGWKPKDRIAYLTLFPIGDTMRANFFVYRAAAEPWTKTFRQDPQTILRAIMPEIADICGDFRVDGPVAIRPIDLTTSEGHRRDGIVLVGDAFCTTCPAPGVGIRRVLTDVDRLCNVYITSWLRTPGMSAEKIAAFYDDPFKRDSDRESMRSSIYSRHIATDDGPVWQLRRLRNNIVRWSLLKLRQTRHF